MAGTLTISTLSDGTNSTSSTNCIQGSARAWVQFQGGNGNTAGTINGSYNVSSITVNGTGDFTLNFTNAMSDANYAALATANQNAGGNPANVSVGYPDNSSTVTYSTTQVRFLVKFGTGSSQLDPTTLSVAIFR